MSTVDTDGELVRVQLPLGGSCGYLKGPGSGQVWAGNGREKEILEYKMETWRVGPENKLLLFHIFLGLDLIKNNVDVIPSDIEFN